MLQQRKKDYFQRIIEEFFAKLLQLLSQGDEVPQSEKREILNEGFKFYDCPQLVPNPKKLYL